MYLFHLFRSFLPLRNPLGFGVTDYLELSVAALLVVLTFTRYWSVSHLRRWAGRTRACMFFLAVLPVALRLLLLIHSPVPPLSGSDDFSYALLGDTLSHLRLANASHPLHQFFETVFVVQEPSYSSIYPLGQGVVLALGQWLLGTPWAGVALSVGLLCALSYWMLRAWTTPVWALIGGLLCVMEFGPLSAWMNSYWGGALAASAGCLVFGALPRLRDSPPRNAALLGLGLALELLTRPFEFILLIGCSLLFFATTGVKRFAVREITKPAAVVLLAVAPALALTLAQNKAVTRNWFTMPYMLSRYQYGVPTSFTFQPNPVPHRALTSQQELDYRAQSAIHGDGLDTCARIMERFVFRLRYYRFFFLAPLYLALVVFLVRIRERRFGWALAALALFSLGTNFYPYFYPHYIAAVTCVCLLVSVKGLEWMGRWPAGRQASRLILSVCAAQFLFWYGLHLFGTEEVWPAFEYETADFINYGDPAGRLAINRQLTEAAGQQLVFVRYSPRHAFENWIHNAADIDASRVVWADDLGPAENQKLLDYFPHRQVWLLDPDAQPPHLQHYPPLTSHP